MQPKTEEFLNLLFWQFDRFMRPTFRNLTDSYEGWAYRNGFMRRLVALERQQMLERQDSSPNDRVYRLTTQGRLHVLGGRDPEKEWARSWDGRWRLVVFDLPVGQERERARVRRYLRGKAFGYLQNSVWITPDPLTEERQILHEGGINVESLLLFEGRPCAGETDAQIVAGAWDFKRINQRYSEHSKVLDERPKGAVRGEAAAKALQRWAAAERETWMKAMAQDPLLPELILPPDYMGVQAWRRRLSVLREAGRQLADFEPS